MPSADSSSDTTSSDETSLSFDDTSENTEEGTTAATDDFDGTLPNLDSVVPLPMPLCLDDDSLPACLDFDDSSLTASTDLSPYQRHGQATDVVQRWSHADASVELLRHN